MLKGLLEEPSTCHFPSPAWWRRNETLFAPKALVGCKYCGLLLWMLMDKEKEVVESLSMEAFKKCVDVVWRDMFSGHGENELMVMVFSSLRDSMTQGSYFFSTQNTLWTWIHKEIHKASSVLSWYKCTSMHTQHHTHQTSQKLRDPPEINAKLPQISFLKITSGWEHHSLNTWGINVFLWLFCEKLI